MARRFPESGILLAGVLAVACAGTIGGLGDDDDGARAGSSADPEGSEPSGPAGLSAHETVARRLTQSELDASLRDLFGDPTAPATTFLPEDEYAPYDNDYTLQVASQALIDSLDALASDVAARVVADPEARARLVPCVPNGNGDAACFEQVVRQLLGRAFRRPLSGDDVAPYLSLLDFATEDSAYVENDFDTAVELLVRAVIQDPEFLYRIEVGEPTDDAGLRQLDGYEVATRLSFLLWGSLPDDELLDAAESGALLDPAGRREQAERLLADTRARDQLHRFHAMWLGYRAIPHPADLVSAFNQETSALIDRIVFDEDRSYLDLFTFPETYLDAFLADHYGLPAPPDGPGWVAYEGSGRAGILSHGSVLAAFSKFSDTSPTQRGIFVRSRLLCEEIPRPPPTVDVDQPPGDDDALCKYDRYEAHRAIPSCASCHSLMDPIGFGLERYDIAGRLRDHDDGLPECIIDGRGELPGYGAFSGPAELGRKLVDSGELSECAVEQFLTFAFGRQLTEAELAATLPEVLARFEQGGLSLREVILGFVEAAPFTLKLEPEVTP